MLANPWFALAAWLISYAADYYLTIYSAGLYRQYAQAHIGFQGSFELTPYYQSDIDALRRVSPRFLLAVLWSVLLLEGMWYLCVVLLKVPELFQFLLGGLVLREAAILLRHLRNIVLFRALRGGQGVEGQLQYARWLTLRQSAAELLGFAALFSFQALVLSSWFLAGGAFACAVTGAQHWRRSRRREAQT